MNKGIGEKNGRKDALIFLLVLFLLSIATIVLGTLCISNAKNVFLKKNVLLFSILLGISVIALYGASVWFVLSDRETLSRSFLVIYIFLAFAFGTCFVLQRTGFFEIVKNTESLQEYLEKAGVWMPIFYILLQFLQVTVLPIPSVVSTVAGVALFGPFWTMIYSLVGILLGSFVAFFIGRRLGNRAVSWIIGEEALKKWQKKLKGKDNLVLTTMFILPIFPDDILCFIAGLSSMSTKYFLIVILLSRVIGIATTCYSVDLIPFNTWWGIGLWLIIAIVIICVFIWVYRNIDKIQKFFQERRKKK